MLNNIYSGSSFSLKLNCLNVLYQHIKEKDLKCSNFRVLSVPVKKEINRLNKLQFNINSFKKKKNFE